MPRRRASRATAAGGGSRLHWSHNRLGARAIRPRSLAAEAVSVLVVLLLPPVVHWRLLAPAADRVYVPSGDFYSQYLPLFHLVRASVLEGRFPLWNPYFHAGRPVLGDPQTSAVYPPLLLWSWLAPAGMPDDRWLTTYVVGSLSLAALATFLAVRALDVARPGALVAAVVFSLGGFLTSYPIEQVTILQSSTWVVPGLVAAIGVGRTARAGRRVSAAAWAAAGGVALGLMSLGGHPQVLLYGGYAVAAIAAWMVAASAIDRADEPVGQRIAGAASTLSAYGLMLVFGLLIGAVQLVPALEFAALSTRTALGFDATSVGLTPLDWLTILLPGSITRHSPLYVGVTSLVLATTAIVGLRGGRHTALLVMVGMLGLLVTVGRASFVEPALYALAPGFALFRDHERAALIWSAALSLLAGIGVATLWHAESSVQPVWRAAARAAGALVVTGAVLSALFLVARSVAAGSQGEHAAMMLNKSVWLFVISLLGLLGLWLGRESGRQHVALSAVAGVLFLELASSAWGTHAAPENPAGVYRSDAAIAYLRAQSGPFRIRNDEAWPPNYGAIHRLEDVGGDNPLQPRMLSALVESKQEWRIWQLLDVRYIASRRVIDDKGVELVFAGDGVNVYRMRYPLGRAWLVERYEVVADEASAIGRVAAPEFDPERQVVLDRPLSFVSGAGSTEGAAPRGVTVTVYEPGRLVVRVAAERPAVLVISELALPGWRAIVDGIEVPVVRADGLLIGVEVPAGQHQVMVEYDPASVRLGAVATAMGVVGLLLVAALWLRQGFRPGS